MTNNETVYPLLAEPSLSQHLGFVLAEEDALKHHLSGITIPARPDSDERIEVGVWFRFPEGERQIHYPFITIDLLSVEPAFDLFHSDHWLDTQDLYRPSFSSTLPAPSGGWAVQGYAIRNYLPFRMMWQVTHYARSSLHDRYLTSIFITDVFPVRPFWLVCPADDTWRRVEHVQFASSNSPETTESGTKRIFRKNYTVNMMAEVPQDFLADAERYKALKVFIPVWMHEEFDAYFTDTYGNSTFHEGKEAPSPT